MTNVSKTATFTMPSDREVVMTRVFDAPRALLWKAYTDPSLIQKWWGPRRYSTVVEKMDVRPGGVWRIVNRGVDGAEYWFNGVFSEVVKPERLVRTFEFEGAPGHIMVETTTFEELEGKTNVTVTSLFKTKEDRDGMVASGMRDGATESMDRLAGLLKEMSR
jgi:uncharacterized protein YndB with AHSA1/START domain